MDVAVRVRRAVVAVLFAVVVCIFVGYPSIGALIASVGLVFFYTKGVISSEGMASSKKRPKPENVGFLALELYIPPAYVDQSDLERFSNESPGKYTIGLGQTSMAFCSDCEDVQSLCLTVTQRLLDRYHVDPRSVGRLEVGTETILDKSKSIKTVLMQLFEPFGNTNMEGVDSKNACFGGTQAVFNAINWIESSSWDGRNALVVAADIAVYGEGPARCTGGAGAVAILIGPNAPIVFDQGVRATYFAHAYDFYKPALDSEYPVVDGNFSIKCYLSALDACYNLYREKAETALGKQKFTLANFDAVVFHSPYAKLVQKSFARLVYLDLQKHQSLPYADTSAVAEYGESNPSETYFDRTMEKKFVDLSREIFANKTEPSLYIGKLVGNMYTPSVYGSLISHLIRSKAYDLPRTRIGIFSYGSGLASALYSVTIRTGNSNSRAALERIISGLSDIPTRLAKRRRATAEEFVEILKIREAAYLKAPYTPVCKPDDLLPGTFFLESIDEKFRRTYKRLPEKEDQFRESNGSCALADGLTARKRNVS